MPEDGRPGPPPGPAGQDGTPGPSTRRFVPMRVVVLLLAMTAITASAASRIMEALIPPIAAEFDASVDEMALVLAAYAVAYAASQLLLGGLADRYGKLEVVAGSAVAGAVALALCGLAMSVGALVFWRAATGAAVASIVALSLAYLGEKTGYAERRAVLAHFMGGTMIGQILGASGAGIVAELAGWRMAFFGLAGAAAFFGVVLAAAMLSGRIVPSVRADRYDPVATFRLLARSNVRWVLVVTATEGAVFFAAAGFVGALLSHRFSLDYASIGLLLSGFGFGGMGYVVLAQRLQSRLGEGATATVGGALAALSYAMMGMTTVIWAVFPLLVVTGFGFYMMHTVLQAKATEMAPDSRGAALGAFVVAMFLGQALGAPVLGIAIERAGFGPTYLAVAAALAILTIGLRRGLRRGAFDPLLQSLETSV